MNKYEIKLTIETTSPLTPSTIHDSLLLSLKCESSQFEDDNIEVLSIIQVRDSD